MSTRYIIGWGAVLGVGIVVPLVCILGADVVSGDTSPELVVEKFDCSGFDVWMINTEPDLTYYITLRGEVENAGGFLWWPTPIQNNEHHTEVWPNEWIWCWLNWCNCWVYDIRLPEPEFIYWSIDLTTEGPIVWDTEYIDMAIPCGYHTYLPLAVKNYNGDSQRGEARGRR